MEVFRIMSKTIEVQYTAALDQRDRQEKLSEILAEGVFSYLKGEGLLKKGSAKNGKVLKLLGEIEFRTPISDEDKKVMSSVLCQQKKWGTGFLF